MQIKNTSSHALEWLQREGQHDKESGTLIDCQWEYKRM